MADTHIVEDASEPGTDAPIVIAGPVRSFDGLCREIQARLGGLRAAFSRECLAIADLFVEAKAIYETSTGTGHGKRNPEGIPSFADKMAEEIGSSASLVHKFLRIAQIDAATRLLVADNVEVSSNLTALLRVAREPDIGKRSEIVTHPPTITVRVRDQSAPHARARPGADQAVTGPRDQDARGSGPSSGANANLVADEPQDGSNDEPGEEGEDAVLRMVSEFLERFSGIREVFPFATTPWADLVRLVDADAPAEKFVEALQLCIRRDELHDQVRMCPDKKGREARRLQREVRAADEAFESILSDLAK